MQKWLISKLKKNFIHYSFHKLKKLNKLSELRKFKIILDTYLDFYNKALFIMS